MKLFSFRATAATYVKSLSAARFGTMCSTNAHNYPLWTTVDYGTHFAN
jgi:hypothetical protein